MHVLWDVPRLREENLMIATVFFPRQAFMALMCAAVLGLTAASQAVTVHTWVDSEGVRHFADGPPADQAPSNEILLKDSVPGYGQDDDYYSIDKQWQRLRAEGEARDALDLERERVEQANRDYYPPPAPEPAPARPNYFPNFYAYPLPYGAPYLSDEYGPPSPRNAFVNKTPPVWPRNR
jgi:Domain of unknown function (DUF4124)